MDLAEAVEKAPVATLTLGAAGFGAIFGGVLGWATGAVLGSKVPLAWTGVGAAVGAFGFGLKGYADGRSLSEWLASNPPSV